MNQNVNQIKKQPHTSFACVEDKQNLKKQLMREIMCLERQISRMTLHRDGLIGSNTIHTYEDMILARKNMLSDISL